MKKSVLVIDDDADDLLFFELALWQINPSCECITSTDPTEALQKLKLELLKPNFIFLDLNMPGMSGQECLREIKKIAHLGDTPVIILTTSISRKDIEEVLLLGAYCCLHKPNTIQELVKSIKKFIDV